MKTRDNILSVILGFLLFLAALGLWVLATRDCAGGGVRQDWPPVPDEILTASRQGER